MRGFRVLTTCIMKLSVALLCFASVLPLAQAQNETIVAHGALPQDKDYWEFHRWYRNHSVLDVVVNGREPQHLKKTLEQVEQLRKRNVLVRDIVVLGGNSFSVLDKSARTQLFKNESLGSEAREAFSYLGIDPGLAAVAEAANVGEGSPAVGIEDIIKRMGITRSPTWIVTYRGELYIYEGFDSVLRQFSRSGDFVSAE